MRSLLPAIVLACSGCASAPQAEAPRPVPAEDAQVARCKYLDTVTGTSAQYGIFAAAGLTNARADALAQAGQLGATHVVWQGTVAGHGSTQMVARAYRCD